MLAEKHFRDLQCLQHLHLVSFVVYGRQVFLMVVLSHFWDRSYPSSTMCGFTSWGVVSVSVLKLLEFVCPCLGFPCFYLSYFVIRLLTVKLLAVFPQKNVFICF